ncbi:MAG: large conductance mechanosensitive channel protein MscL, partial [Sphingobacteriaceae bacterium]
MQNNFLSQVIAFLIVALALFILIKAINKMQRKQPVAEPVEVKA